jgi:hypothetical protein
MHGFRRPGDRIGGNPPTHNQKSIDVDRKINLFAGVMAALWSAVAAAQVTGTITNAKLGPARSPVWGAGTLADVSFIGYLPPLGSGTNPGTPLQGAFRNQALEFRFDAPLDAGVLGGFFIMGGSPVQLLGASPTLPGIPYFPFVDQVGAKASLQIRENAGAGPLLASYIVGRHAIKLDTIVVDPVVPPGYPIPANPGFNVNQEYVYAIPPGNGFLFNGHPATAELPLPFPVVVPAGIPPPLSAKLFRSNTAFAPDPVPPAVLSITALSGLPGTPANPILASDPIVIAFSKIVSSASIDLTSNFLIRNLGVAPPTMPGGALVPGTVAPFTPGAIDDAVYVFTPAAPYGPGMSPGVGFDVEVVIGGAGPPLLGLPQGLAGTQLPLSNSLNQVFRTTSCGACPTPVAVGEGFDDANQRDTTFLQPFGPPGVGTQARWANANAPSQLAGRLTTGSASGTTPATLGTRIQIVVDPQPPSPFPGGLFAPFDSSLANSGGQCPTSPTGCNLGPSINPNGGSHIMHLYESAEFLNLEDSLEQVEWSPVNSVTFASMYPNYKVWCGLTNIAAPINAPGATTGMNAVFDSNYNLTPYQTGVPVQAMCASPTAINPRKVPCGGPMSYAVALQLTQFYPFPLLNPCFDFATSTGASGAGVNLLLEQDIDPGNQVPNFNRYRATFFTPVRRLIDKPISTVNPLVCPFNNGGTYDVYRMRFTFVGIVGHARSLWYDTGVADPSYLGFQITPPPSAQPPGTQSTWILEGTDTVNPVPTTTGVSGTYVNAAGTVFPLVVTSTINQLRYFRFKVELRGNNVTNATPSYDSVTMAYSF